MHGDKEVSTKELARQIGVKSIQPCERNTAQNHTGYLVGGTSPFGTKKALPIYIQASILQLDKIYLNAGQRGLLVSLAPSNLKSLLNPISVDVARQWATRFKDFEFQKSPPVGLRNSLENS